MTDLPTPDALSLDPRSQDIFRQIVDAYLSNGEPIGSRSISRALPQPLSPASVRNVMADLEDAGLIYAPHTSAGRLPTDQGLRFFVDAMLDVGELSSDERDTIERHLSDEEQRTGTVDAALNKASQLLSGMSSGAGVVLAAKQDMRLKHIEFVALEPGKGIVILVGEDGQVENRVVDLPAGLPPSALQEASNYLNSQIRGVTVADARRIIAERAAKERAALDALTARLVDDGIATWSEASDQVPGNLIVHGRSNLLQNLDVRADVERVRQLLDDLEAKEEMMRLLSLTEEGDGVRIFIGSENKLFSLSGSSLVLA
ncbi:MAG: heat-inducible transcriptional repressor HrcA [Pseudomonadota bacterium]